MFRTLKLSPICHSGCSFDINKVLLTWNINKCKIIPWQMTKIADIHQNFSTKVHKTNSVNRDQTRNSFRPPIDPRGTSFFMFPGQGSQFVGMIKNDLLSIPNVPEMFEIASSILKYDLLNLCINGPKEELDKTANCQAAVLVTSLAAVEKIRYEDPEAIEKCVGSLGFSVGEFTALVFAGAISFEDGVRLVKIRGEAMQAASEITPSGMMTVFYGPDSKLNFACHTAKEWCRREGIEDPVCEIANYLFPHCKVIAGNEEALKFIEINYKDFKLRKLKRLPVSGAFHTDLMKPAKIVLEKALDSINLTKPLIPVYSNVDTFRYRNEDEIRKKLVKQLYSPVKWEQTLHAVYERPVDSSFPSTYECGPGKSLTAILKCVNLKAANTSQSVLK